MRRIKWTIVRYLVGQRMCMVNVDLVNGEAVRLSEGALIANCNITGRSRGVEVL